MNASVGRADGKRTKMIERRRGGGVQTFSNDLQPKYTHTHTEYLRSGKNFNQVLIKVKPLALLFRFFSSSLFSSHFAVIHADVVLLVFASRILENFIRRPRQSRFFAEVVTTRHEFVFILPTKDLPFKASFGSRPKRP